MAKRTHVSGVMAVMHHMGFATKKVTEQDSLEMQLHQAEASENFEQAAEIKRQIEALKKTNTPPNQ